MVYRPSTLVQSTELYLINNFAASVTKGGHNVRLATPLFQISVALLLSSWLPSLAHADEMWAVVAKKSHFGHGLNTLVIKRPRGLQIHESDATNADAGTRFLVISGGNVYLGVDEQTRYQQEPSSKLDLRAGQVKSLFR